MMLISLVLSIVDCVLNYLLTVLPRTLFHSVSVSVTTAF